MSAAGKVVYWVQDLLFVSKIRGTAEALGVTVEPARDPASVLAAAAGARLVVIDLRRPGALELLEKLAADPATASTPRAGFIDHEAVEVITRARELGCAAYAKGKFTTELPRLLGG